MGNPPVFFDSTTSPDYPTINLDGYASEVQTSYYPNPFEDVVVTKAIEDPVCETFPLYSSDASGAISIPAAFNGYSLLFDWRHSLQSNTLEQPLLDGGGNMKELTRNDADVDSRGHLRCFNAPMTFVSEDSCVLSYEPNVCSSSDPTDFCKYWVNYLLEQCVSILTELFR